MILKEAQPKKMSDIIEMMPSLGQIKDDLHKWIFHYGQKLNYDYRRSEYDKNRITGATPRYFKEKTKSFQVPDRIVSSTPIGIKITINPNKNNPTLTFKLVTNIAGHHFEPTQTVSLYDFDSWSNYDYGKMYDSFIRDIRREAEGLQPEEAEEAVAEIVDTKTLCDYIKKNKETFLSDFDEAIKESRLNIKYKGTDELEKLIDKLIEKNISDETISELLEKVEAQQNKGLNFNLLASELYNFSR